MSAPSTRVVNAGSVRNPEAISCAHEVRLSQKNGVLVIAPQGVFDEASVAALDDVINGAPASPTVIDLSECTLTDPTVLRPLEPTRWGCDEDRICVVCSRLSGRRLMSLAGVPRRFAVFERTEDALQARVFAVAGYGDGWLHEGG